MCFSGIVFVRSKTSQQKITKRSCWSCKWWARNWSNVCENQQSEWADLKTQSCNKKTNVSLNMLSQLTAQISQLTSISHLVNCIVKKLHHNTMNYRHDYFKFNFNLKRQLKRQLTFNLTWSVCVTANRGLLSSFFYSAAL